MKVDPRKDQIAIYQKSVPINEELAYFTVNKPRNMISAASPQKNHQTRRDLVEKQGHIYLVGKLFVESEGLILLTNDGELSNQLTHPRI
jgi:23S rRNA pseudouridine2605 synthase